MQHLLPQQSGLDTPALNSIDSGPPPGHQRMPTGGAECAPRPGGRPARGGGKRMWLQRPPRDVGQPVQPARRRGRLGARWIGAIDHPGPGWNRMLRRQLGSSELCLYLCGSLLQQPRRLPGRPHPGLQPGHLRRQQRVRLLLRHAEAAGRRHRGVLCTRCVSLARQSSSPHHLSTYVAFVFVTQHPPSPQLRQVARPSRSSWHSSRS